MPIADLINLGDLSPSARIYLGSELISGATLRDVRGEVVPGAPQTLCRWVLVDLQPEANLAHRHRYVFFPINGGPPIHIEHGWPPRTLGPRL